MFYSNVQPKMKPRLSTVKDPQECAKCGNVSAHYWVNCPKCHEPFPKPMKYRSI